MSIADFVNALPHDPNAVTTIAELRRRYGQPIHRSLFVAELGRAGVQVGLDSDGRLCAVGIALKPPARVIVDNGRIRRVAAVV
jgi:hypothetical protein